MLAVLLVALAPHAAADHLGDPETGHVPPGTDLTPHPGITAGAGIDGFLGKRARETFSPGPSWNVRLGLFNKSEIRLELVYAGSSQAINGASGRLVGHGAHGLLRVNVLPNRVVEPFFYAGGGWTRFSVSGMNTEVESPDDVIEIPFGVGAAWRSGRFVVDARAGMSIVSGANLLPRADTSTSTEGHSMHRFGIRANVGIEL